MKKYSSFFDVIQKEGQPHYFQSEDKNCDGISALPLPLPFDLSDKLLAQICSMDSGAFDVSVTLFEFDMRNSTDWYEELKLFLKQGQKLAITGLEADIATKDNIAKQVVGEEDEKSYLNIYLRSLAEKQQSVSSIAERQQLVASLGDRFDKMEMTLIDGNEIQHNKKDVLDQLSMEIDKMNLKEKKWVLVIHSKQRFSRDKSLSTESRNDIEARRDSISSEYFSDLDALEERVQTPGLTNRLANISPLMLLNGLGDSTLTRADDGDRYTPTPTPETTPRYK